MFIYKVVSVLINSGSVLSIPQSFGQSFASASYTDAAGRLISKNVYTDTSGTVIFDGNAPEPIIGLVPPFSGDYNDIDRLSQEPILIIKPPPFTRRTTSYTTAYTTTTKATTRAPVTTPTRATIAPKIITKTPTPFVFRVFPTKSSNSYKSSGGGDGKYRYSGEDGSYKPKGNTGTYTHNNAGAYRHSNSGAYKPDDRGKYKGN